MDRYTPKCKLPTESSTTCEENEIFNTNYDNVITLADSSSSLDDCVPSKDDVELSLELEITDSLRHIIDEPKRCSSDLLDVTIIKSSDGNPLGNKETNILRAEEVRNFIQSIKHVNENRRKLLAECKHKLRGNDKDDQAKKDIGVMSTPIKPNNNHRETTGRRQTGRSEKISQSTAVVRQHQSKLIKGAKETEIGDQKSPKRQKSSEKVKSREILNQQKLKPAPLNPKVYATVKTLDHLKKVFPCQRPHEADPSKPDKPCLCEHCGVIGVLVESQKHPVTYSEEQITNSPWTRDNNEFPDDRYYRIPPSKEWRGYPDIIDDLNERLRLLEIRLQRHEAKVVSRDYFKRVISKLVSYIQPRYDQVLHFDRVTKTMQKRNMSTQCSRAILKREMSRYYQKEYCVRPVLIHQPEEDEKNIENKQGENSEKEKTVPQKNSSHLECFWRWGEEIVKPGFDLKDRMLALLEEKISSFKSAPQKRATMDIQISCVDSDKTLFLKGSEPKITPQKPRTANADSRRATGSHQQANQFKQMLDVMSTKIYEDYIQDKVCNPVSSEASTKCTRNTKKEADERSVNKQNARTHHKTNTKRELLTQPRPRGPCSLSSGQKGIRSGIPVRSPPSPRRDTKKSMIPKLQKDNERLPAKRLENKEAKCLRSPFSGDLDKSNTVEVTYFNPKVKTWLQDSYACLKSEIEESKRNPRTKRSGDDGNSILTQENVEQNQIDTDKSKLAKQKNKNAKCERIWGSIWTRKFRHNEKEVV